MNIYETALFSLLQASEDLLMKHYVDLKDRPFFPTLINYMRSGPVVAMVRLYVCMHVNSSRSDLNLIICHGCFRCGKARVWWRQAGWCWERPTLLILSLEPSEETSVLMSASELSSHDGRCETIACMKCIVTFWLCPLLKEHHPWQWLGGECQQGNFLVV